MTAPAHLRLSAPGARYPFLAPLCDSKIQQATYKLRLLQLLVTLLMHRDGHWNSPGPVKVEECWVLYQRISKQGCANGVVKTQAPAALTPETLKGQV